MKIFKAILAIAILSVSCSKDNDEPQPETPKVATVYVGGGERNANNKYVPIIWKNGVAQQLPLSAGSEGEVLAIFVDGNDVYAIGNEYTSNTLSTYRAAIWKNGVKTILSTNPSNTKAIYVSNGKPYVVGMDNGIAKLWYDNTTVDLIDCTGATGIYVKNNEIFISGNTATGMGFWKNNGSQTFLLHNTSYLPITIARAISVQDNNVYIAGYTETTEGIRSAKIWNANLVSTEQFGDDTMMWSVFVLGQNVFASGRKIINLNGSRAMLWKNSQPTQLSQNESFANSVFATATDNYVAGYETISITKACIWKNGTIQTLSANNSAATSVFVTEK